ncbi:unnamed protein product [Chironomus riparius]|uniref:C2H2-type domain-containing protein n=1 Tax=Chironomus riparius TaxID=315576 RepID=A0A9N9RXU8_9DIPT|nr:unnamed protein product [Chironomus riparius]
MEKLEKLIDPDNCMVCGILMGCYKNSLTVVTSYTQKPIFQLIEEFTNTHFSEDIVNEGGVCDSCIEKFYEYDQYQNLAQKIQEEIVSLFDSSVSENDDQQGDLNDQEVKSELIEDDEIVYDNIEDVKATELLLAEAMIETANDNQSVEVDLVEVDFLDNTKLPREFQSPEDKHKVIKSKFIKSEGDDSVIVVQLDNNAKLFQCEICERTFKEKSKLKSHRQIHTTERNFVCPTCNKAFKTQACLRSHRRVHNPVTIECDYCGKLYTQKPELIKHINFVHFNRRDYHCEICNASFGCKGHLKAHYLTHQQFRGISCEVCGYSFHTRAKLQRHMKSHSGVRDYECGICHKRFLYSYNVSAHIRHVHWKEKRKVDESSRTCSVCSKKFQKIWKLREHLQVEHQLIETEIIDECEILEDGETIEMEELVEA